MKLSEEKAKILAAIFVALTLIDVAGTREYCTEHMPEAPEPEIGRTIPLEANHLKIVYLTPSEARKVDVADDIAKVFGFMVVMIIFLRCLQEFKEGLHEKA